MRHNDYIVVGACKQCGAKIYTPVSWIGGKDKNPRPQVWTCNHKRI